MQKQSFQIEFFAVENNDEVIIASALIRYKALITVISRNFQLFKVSRIQKLGNEYIINLSDSYFITSYPSTGNGDTKWKDASTFEPNHFFQMIGAAIENVEIPANVHEYSR